MSCAVQADQHQLQSGVTKPIAATVATGPATASPVAARRQEGTSDLQLALLELTLSRRVAKSLKAIRQDAAKSLEAMREDNAGNLKGLREETARLHEDIAHMHRTLDGAIRFGQLCLMVLASVAFVHGLMVQYGKAAVTEVLKTAARRGLAAVKDYWWIYAWALLSFIIQKVLHELMR